MGSLVNDLASRTINLQPKLVGINIGYVLKGLPLLYLEMQVEQTFFFSL